MKKTNIKFAVGTVLILLLFSFLRGNSIFSSVQWFRCRLVYDDQKLIHFSHAEMGYVLRMVRVKDGSDCSKMWGGFPSMQDAYVAVSLESATEVFPLGGLSGSFLNIHKIIDSPSGVTIIGGDGGVGWRAFCDIDRGLKVKSISDDRVILKFLRL